MSITVENVGNCSVDRTNKKTKYNTLMSDFIMHSSSGILVPEHLTFPRAAAVYCDESGNSGPNYLDRDQPFYVLAGWLVPDDGVVDVNVAIETFRTANFPQRDELKAAAVLRNEAAKRKCVDLFHTLGGLHCVPMYLIAEKRYGVATKLVETFLDPAYNNVLLSGFTGDTVTKQEIANTLYERLPDRILRQFAEAYRAPDADALGAALRKVMTAVEEYISPELARAISGSASFIDEIARVEASTSPLGNVMSTLNLPCLVSFLMLIENLGRIGMAQPITVLHDQQHAYQEGYKRVFDLHRGMVDWFARFPHTNAIYSNLRHVARFEMRESRETLPIQAADLLAGVIHHLCRLAMKEAVVTDGDLALAELIFPALFVPTPRLTSLVCSDAFIRAIGPCILKPMIQISTPEDSEAGRKLEAMLAPMFPIKKLGIDVAPSQPTLPLDLPLFGLVGERHNLLIIDDPNEKDQRFRRLLVLFTSADRAMRFLEPFIQHGLIEPQQIVEFGPSALEQLLELLREAAHHTAAMTINPGERRDTPQPCLRVSEAIDKLEMILERTHRMFRSGLNNVLLEKHSVGSKEILTMQISDGRYAALESPESPIFFGTTREEALTNLCQANGLLPDSV